MGLRIGPTAVMVSLTVLMIGAIPQVNSDSAWLPPKIQSQNGVPFDKIICPDDLQLVMKKSDQSPACVKNTTVSLLLERGWGLQILSENVEISKSNSESFRGGNYEVTSREIKYSTNATGFLAMPVAGGNFPGIVMIHEWWGLNQNIKQMAEKLASYGYVVLAVDLYHGQVANTSEEAGRLIGAFDQNKATVTMQEASAYLKQHGSNKVGSVGWCFGGGQSLNFALNVGSDATVVYYGRPVFDKEKLSSISSPILGIYGREDKNIPVSDVVKFESELDDLGIDNEFHIYDEAGHAFANPSAKSYFKSQAQDAWSQTIAFLAKNLQS